MNDIEYGRMKNEDFHSKISKAVEKMKNRPVSQKIKTLVEIGSITQEQADLILSKIPNPELPLHLIETSEADLKSAKIKYYTDDFSVEDLIEELLIWHGTFRDAPDNFDAKLLKKAASVLQEQWDRIGELEDMLDLKNA
jgi:hypothetical protein